MLSVQLEIRYPLDLMRIATKTASIRRISNAALHEIVGEVTSVIKSEHEQEILVDCGIPLRLITWDPPNEFVDRGDFLAGIGEIMGYISFDVRHLHKPIAGRIIKVEGIGQAVKPRIVTVQTEFVGPKEEVKLTWFRP